MTLKVPPNEYFQDQKNGFFFADQNWFSIKVFIWGEPLGGLLAWFVFFVCVFVTEPGVRWVGSSETEERQNTESPVSLKQLVKGRPQRPHRLEHFHKVRQAVFGHRVPSRAPGVLLDLYNNVQKLILAPHNQDHPALVLVVLPLPRRFSLPVSSFSLTAAVKESSFKISDC